MDSVKSNVIFHPLPKPDFITYLIKAPSGNWGVSGDRCLEVKFDNKI